MLCAVLREGMSQVTVHHQEKLELSVSRTSHLLAIWAGVMLAVYAALHARQADLFGYVFSVQQWCTDILLAAVLCANLAMSASKETLPKKLSALAFVVVGYLMSYTVWHVTDSAYERIDLVVLSHFGSWQDGAWADTSAYRIDALEECRRGKLQVPPETTGRRLRSPLARVGERDRNRAAARTQTGRAAVRDRGAGDVTYVLRRGTYL